MVSTMYLIYSETPVNYKLKVAKQTEFERESLFNFIFLNIVGQIRLSFTQHFYKWKWIYVL